jgi:hypothetical protein
MTRASTPTFDAKQLSEEIIDRSYLMPTEIEVYVKNLIRIVYEQQQKIDNLLRIASYGPHQ